MYLGLGVDDLCIFDLVWLLYLQESKKFKRLKKGGGDVEVGYFGYYDDEDNGGVGRSGRIAEEYVKRSLFGDEDGGKFMFFFYVLCLFLYFDLLKIF